VIAGAFTGLSADAGSFLLSCGLSHLGKICREVVGLSFFSVDLSGWACSSSSSSWLPFSLVVFPPLLFLACVVDLGLSSRG